MICFNYKSAGQFHGDESNKEKFPFKIFINNLKITTNYVTINLLINSISITLLSNMLKTKCLAFKAGFVLKSLERCTSSSQGSKVKKMSKYILSK